MTHQQQADFDMLLVNLRMDATYIKEGMNINWISEVRYYKSSVKALVVLFNFMNLVESGEGLVFKC